MQSPSREDTAPPWRIGLIGVGKFGIDKVGLLREDPRFRVMAGCDRSSAACYRLHGVDPSDPIPAFRSLDEFLEKCRPDAYVVATTAPGHVPVTEALLDVDPQARILVEKPLSDSLAAADRLTRRIETASHPDGVRIDFPRRLVPAFRKLRSLRADGKMGEIQGIEVQCRGTLGMNGSHFIDLGLWIMGVSPWRVEAELDYCPPSDNRGSGFVDPEGHIVLTFRKGVEARITCDRNVKPTKERIGIHFEDGSLWTGPDEAELVLSRPKRREEVISVGGALGRRQRFLAALAALTSGRQRDDLATVKEGMEGLMVIAAAMEAAARGEPVDFPLADRSAWERSLRIA